MKYAKLFNRHKTPQSAPILGSGQVPNSAGGYAWQVDRWAMLDRFLILGSEGGTFYIDERKLTLDNATNVIEAIAEDGLRVVNRIVEISEAGRAPKNDPAIFALALVATVGDQAAKTAAFTAVPRVCRTGTHLFAFAEAVDGMRGWGRGLRNAIGRWYNAKTAEGLEYQLVKYVQREGWSHRDLLRLAHPKAASEQHQVLFKWAVDSEVTGRMPLVEAVQALQGVGKIQAAEMIRQNKIPREGVPTELLSEPEVWDALLDAMPMTAMIRNLATMTRVGLLTPLSDATKKVVTELDNEDRLRKARMHPIAVLLAHATYESGRGVRGKNTWTPVPRIVDALDRAFYRAFANVEPTNKRYLLGVDVSGSMTMGMVAGTPLTPNKAAGAMAMVAMKSEERVVPMAFSHRLIDLHITPQMPLHEVIRTMDRISFGATDCSLPMQYALKRKLPVDVFVVYTDNETWYGKIHPAQALRQYREEMGIPAKLVVVGMVANQFTIADPRDGGMLDVVGFDASVPQVMAEFVK